MIKAILARMQQKHRTIRYPVAEPILPDRYMGKVAIDSGKCNSSCRQCLEVCSTDAITKTDTGIRMDLGRCLFCGACQRVCPQGAIQFTREYRMATRRKEDLVIADNTARLGEFLDQEAHRLFGRSLKLRQVSAGGCNACEVEVAVLGIVVYDLGRFGIQYVASPRHADGILITGPVTKNMVHALRETYAAVPPPKLVIAVGACALSGGLFANTGETLAGVPDDIRVDLFIPGCPPHPFTLLDGYLRLLGKIDQKMDKRFRDAVSSSPASR